LKDACRKQGEEHVLNIIEFEFSAISEVIFATSKCTRKIKIHFYE
jgi:hypothetical protein